MFDFKQYSNHLVFQKKLVWGITKFNDTIEGNHIDNCTVIFIAPLNESTGNARGFGTAKVAYGQSVNFHEFDKMSFPCEMELAFQTVTNASGKSKEVLKAVRAVRITKQE